MSNIINIGGGAGGSGSNVVPNPQGTATDTLTKIGIDGTIYGFAGNGGHTYSTTEQVVGTWVDGSTLYEKTVTNVSLTHNTWTTVFDGSSINAQIKDYEGKISLDGSTPYCPIDYYRAQNEFSSGCIANSGTEVRVLASILNPETLLYCTIRYTKSST